MKVTVKIDERFFEVEVGDLTARPVLAKIDCDTFEVWPVEEGQAGPNPGAAPETTVEPAASRTSKPLVVESAAAVGKPAVGAKAVLAPIPGVIVSINVKVGDEVVFGQELCLLEAMKMKNSIRANRVGKIASISVCSGDHVRHGQILLEYSE